MQSGAIRSAIEEAKAAIEHLCRSYGNMDSDVQQGKMSPDPDVMIIAWDANGKSKVGDSVPGVCIRIERSFYNQQLPISPLDGSRETPAVVLSLGLNAVLSVKTHASRPEPGQKRRQESGTVVEDSKFTMFHGDIVILYTRVSQVSQAVSLRK